MDSSYNQRYRRQIKLTELGRAGQQLLTNARILVVGAGGLGCPALLYLTAAGIGTIGIMDPDLVSITNLHRQVLYSEKDEKKPKVEAAKHRLTELNNRVNFETYDYSLEPANARSIISQFDLVIDGSDNFETRYLINDACVLEDKPFIYGAVHRFEGQVSVFNYIQDNGEKGPTYRCLYPEMPDPQSVPSCAETGVIGVLPGIIGSYQANEAIKMIAGIGKVLSGKMMIIDLLNNETSHISLTRSAQAANVKILVNYGFYCKTDSRFELTVNELEEWKVSDKKFKLIDIREKEEVFEGMINGAVYFSVNSILREQNQLLSGHVPIVFYCDTGKRSGKIVNNLLDRDEALNIYSLLGGIKAWRNK